MVNSSKIGAALVGGYLLGRTKKAKLVVALGMLLAGRKLSLDPKQLGSMVADSPLLSGLSEQVRKELLEGTKSAASSALTKRIGGLADSLHDRTAQLDRGDEDDGDDEPDEPDEHDADLEDDEDGSGLEDDHGDEEPPARQAVGGAARRAGSDGRKARSGTRRTGHADGRPRHRTPSDLQARP